MASACTLPSMVFTGASRSSGSACAAVLAAAGGGLRIGPWVTSRSWPSSRSAFTVSMAPTGSGLGVVTSRLWPSMVRRASVADTMAVTLASSTRPSPTASPSESARIPSRETGSTAPTSMRGSFPGRLAGGSLCWVQLHDSGRGWRGACGAVGRGPRWPRQRGGSRDKASPGIIPKPACIGRMTTASALWHTVDLEGANALPNGGK